jgi:exopolysaccharide biosynthesis polyprenyl glycosylphosphotransferase
MGLRKMSEAVADGDNPTQATRVVGHGRLGSLPPDWLPAALLLGDAVIAALSVAFGFWVRYGSTAGAASGGPYLAATPVVVILYVFALSVTSQYNSWRGRTLMDKLIGLYSGIGLATVLILALIEVGYLGQMYSRFIILIGLLFTAVVMTGERYVLRAYETWLRRRGIGTERVLMVGSGAASEILIRRLTMFPQYGFQIIGVASDETATGARFIGLPVIGRVSDVRKLTQDLGIDQVFFALPLAQRARLSALTKTCEEASIEYKIVPDLLDDMSTRVATAAIDGLPLVGVRKSRLHGEAAAAKRVIDVVISTLLLITLSPVLLAVAGLIKLLMPGPVLFRQERIGRDGRPFFIYKFRSMIRDAEAAAGPTIAQPRDPRVTGLGRLMRRLSIDELPQLFNVVRGDMSLVGPRPQPTYFDERYGHDVPRYPERRSVRPGLTGWAEVNDLRGAAPIVDRTMYDIYYIEHWSLTLDLKCVLLTVTRILSQRHAY